MGKKIADIVFRFTICAIAVPFWVSVIVAAWMLMYYVCLVAYHQFVS